ncbi:hypothetical protein TrRE_jg635 [Triparma retinervis]|uniref:Uncharacterized protein n=1 Tax=Triparma retinervis TaxID=2557542 RepID=A0A9W6ZX09_9STRA|nr:hypothetical protein TrRE_jg635 [Triparma retinervis]
MGSAPSKPSTGCKTPCNPANMDYVKETCSWWSFWCSEKEYCLSRQSAAPASAVRQEQYKSEHTTIPLSCIAGGCEGNIEKLPADACGPGWSPNGPLVTSCGREAGFCQTPDCRPCDPGKGSKIFSIYDYNLDLGICYVSDDRPSTQYQPYIWDGCPGLSPTSSVRFGLYTSSTLVGEQRPSPYGQNGEFTDAPIDATCTEVGGGNVLTEQPPDVQRTGAVVEAMADKPNMGNPTIGGGVGMLGGLGAACVVGLGWRRKKMRTRKGGEKGDALEMAGGRV